MRKLGYLALCGLAALLGWTMLGRATLPAKAAARERRVTPAPAGATANSLAATMPLPTGASRPVSIPLPSALLRSGVATLDDALRLLPTLEGDDRTTYFQTLITFAVREDPLATVTALVAMKDGSLRDFGVSFGVQAWAEAQPAEALAWAAAHPRGANDHTWFHAAYEGYAEQQPLEALQLLVRAEVADDLDALTRIAVYHAVSAGQLDVARPWIESLPEGELRDLLAQNVVRCWAPRDPEAAVAWLASTTTDRAFRSGMNALVPSVCSTNPRLAAGLAVVVADPPFRQALLGDVIYLWSKQDLGAAAAWLRGQPASAQFDAARVRLAEATAPFDLAEARQWATAITDGRQQLTLRSELHLDAR
jgi:hypothetical protein